MSLQGFYFLNDCNRVIVCVFSTLLEPSGLFLCSTQCRQQKKGTAIF